MLIKALTALVLLTSLKGWGEALTESLPVQLTRQGPNCWNSTLVHSGVLNAYRFVGAEEFLTLLQSDLCQEISEAEVRPGDIRAYLRSVPNLSLKDQTVHGNIFLDKERSLNKMHLYLTSPIQIDSQRDVNREYGTTSPSVKLQTKDGKYTHCKGESCKNRQVFYRCTSVEAKIRAENPGLYSLFQGISDELNRYVRFDYRRSFNLSSLKSNADHFKEWVGQYCWRSTSFACSYYKSAIISFETQLNMEQPSVKWLTEYFEPPTPKSSVQNSNLEDVLSMGSFANHFAACAARDGVFAYIGREPYSNVYKVYIHDHSLGKRTSQKLTPKGLNGLSFNEDCSQITATFLDKSQELIETSLSYKRKSEEKIEFEASISKRHFGESRVVVRFQGQSVTLFENEVGRFAVLGKASNGIYILKENLIEQSIRFVSLPKLNAQTVLDLKPKVKVEASQILLPHKDKRSLPAYLFASPKETDTLILHVHGGGCWTESHVDPVSYSPEAYDFLKAGYDLVTISYSGDDGGPKGLIPEVQTCGVDELSDLISAVHFASKLYKNIFLIGESYGAYLINLAIGQYPDLPISGAISKSGVWSLRLQKNLNSNLNALETTEFTEPKLHIPQIRTPLLIFHGQYDEAVDYGNAREFFQVAQQAGLKYESFTPEHMKHQLNYSEHSNKSYALKWHDLLLNFIYKHRRK